MASSSSKGKPKIPPFKVMQKMKKEKEQQAAEGIPKILPHITANKIPNIPTVTRVPSPDVIAIQRKYEATMKLYDDLMKKGSFQPGGVYYNSPFVIIKLRDTLKELSYRLKNVRTHEYHEHLTDNVIVPILESSANISDNHFSVSTLAKP